MGPFGKQGVSWLEPACRVCNALTPETVASSEVLIGNDLGVGPPKQTLGDRVQPKSAIKTQLGRGGGSEFSWGHRKTSSVKFEWLSSRDAADADCL